MANFWGTKTMTGRNKVNAMNTKSIPVARSKPKYKRDFPEGMLLVADWKFPGKSFTPFETLKWNEMDAFRIRSVATCPKSNILSDWEDNRFRKRIISFKLVKQWLEKMVPEPSPMTGEQLNRHACRDQAQETS